MGCMLIKNKFLQCHVHLSSICDTFHFHLDLNPWTLTVVNVTVWTQTSFHPIITLYDVFIVGIVSILITINAYFDYNHLHTCVTINNQIKTFLCKFIAGNSNIFVRVLLFERLNIYYERYLLYYGTYATYIKN